MCALRDPRGGVKPPYLNHSTDSGTRYPHAGLYIGASSPIRVGGTAGMRPGQIQCFSRGAAVSDGAAPVAQGCGDRLFSHPSSESWRPTQSTINLPGPPRWGESRLLRRIEVKTACAEWSGRNVVVLSSSSSTSASSSSSPSTSRGGRGAVPGVGLATD